MLRLKRPRAIIPRCRLGKWHFGWLIKKGQGDLALDSLLSGSYSGLTRAGNHDRIIPAAKTGRSHCWEHKTSRSWLDIAYAFHSSPWPLQLSKFILLPLRKAWPLLSTQYWLLWLCVREIPASQVTVYGTLSSAVTSPQGSTRSFQKLTLKAGHGFCPGELPNQMGRKHSWRSHRNTIH